MRAAILIFAMLLPALVSAQSGAATSTAPPAVAAAQAPSQAAANPPARQRRRGTMVGYIADGTIEDYVRVRFDAGYDNNVPDRAEFFYAQCGCNDPSAPGPGAQGPGDLVTSLNFQQLFVDVQYAPHERVAVFGSVPFRFLQPQTFLGQTFPQPLANTFDGGSGLSDIRAGVKASIFSSDSSLLTAQVQFFFPSGDSEQGLGTDHSSFEGALLFHHAVSERFTVEGQFGDWHPIGGSTLSDGTDYAGDVLFYGIGPSFELVNNGRLRFAPVIELVGWRVLGGLQQPGAAVPPPAEGTNIVNLKFGARTTFDERSSLYVGYGHALTDAQWYNDILRVEYKYSF